jgi:hypothetical protein
VVLEQDVSRVVISFTPAFPLPDRSRFVLRVDRAVTDLTGGFELADHAGRTALRAQAELALVQDPTGPLATFAVAHPMEVDPRTFLVFTTRDEAAADVERTLAFDGTDVDVDGGPGVQQDRTNASFDGTVPGAVAGAVTVAGGDGRLGGLEPLQSIVLDTDSSAAENGVFHFQRIRIPSGVTVTLRGSRPAVLRSREDVVIEGRIETSGAAGTPAEASVTTASLPQQAGGVGGAGAGAGGDSFTGPAFGMRGESGGDAFGEGGLGGEGGGETASTSIYSFPGGGGGGGHATSGESGLGGGYVSVPSYNGPGGAAGEARGRLPSSLETADGRDFSGTGGGGGGAGGNNHFTTFGYRTSGAGGGGGGGAVLISSAGNIRFAGVGAATGGVGGTSTFANNVYGGGPGGGGAGGTISLFAAGDLDVGGALFQVNGGDRGSNFVSLLIGFAGRGGDGFLRLEDADGTPSGLPTANLPNLATTTGRFEPSSRATDPPSVFTGTWFVLPGFQPQVQPFLPEDLPQSLIPGAEIRWEIQMADDSPLNPGRPDLATVNGATGASSDPDRASGWVLLRDAISIRDVSAELNGRGFQHFRIRVSFLLPDGLRAEDPMPRVDSFRVRIRHQD